MVRAYIIKVHKKIKKPWENFMYKYLQWLETNRWMEIGENKKKWGSFVGKGNSLDFWNATLFITGFLVV